MRDNAMNTVCFLRCLFIMPKITMVHNGPAPLNKYKDRS